MNKLTFSNNLFWDIDEKALDLKLNKRFIIQRVIEFGTLNDWKAIKAFYGIHTIGLEMEKVRNLDKISLAFLCMVTGKNKKEFRCFTTKQSIPQHWDF